MVNQLKPKQEMFCKEYIIDLNGTQAAIRAGYSHKTARQIATEMLSKLYIQEYVQSLMDSRSKKVEITAENILLDILDTREAAKEQDKLSERLKCNELLGKHLKMFTDRLDVSSKQEISLSESDKEIIERFINKTKGADK